MIFLINVVIGDDDNKCIGNFIFVWYIINCMIVVMYFDYIGFY